MRRKEDFVTNSSSSSFIVAWPKKVTKWKQVHEIVIFKEKADVVYDDCLKQKPFLIKETESCINKITEEISKGYFYGYASIHDNPEYNQAYHDKVNKTITDDEYRKILDTCFNKLEEENKKRARVIAEKFVKENIGKYCYMFHYGDEDGYFYSQLEHGDTFRGLKHLQISHH